VTGPRRRLALNLGEALAAQAVDREPIQHRLRIEKARSTVRMRYRWCGILSGWDWWVVDTASGTKLAVGWAWTEARMLVRLERAYKRVLDEIARDGAA
jgi:hypothetical protein